MSSSGIHESIGISLERSTAIIDLFYDNFLDGYQKQPDPLPFSEDALRWILHEPALSIEEMVYLTYFFTRIILPDARREPDSSGSSH